MHPLFLPLALLAADGSGLLARVPNSTAVLEIPVEGFHSDPAALQVMQRELAERAVLIGSLESPAARISVVAEPDERAQSSAAWRERLAGAEGERFEIDGIACVEVHIERDGAKVAHFHAFVTGARLCFDLHLSQPEAAEPSKKFTREAFSAIVRGARIAILRRGGLWSDYPRELLERLHAASTRMSTWKPWLESERTAHPDDWTIPWTQAEIVRYLHGPPAFAVESYTATIALLAKKTEATAPEDFARVVAEDGLGLAQVELARQADSLEHFRTGYDLALKRKFELTGPLAYNLACSYAETHAEREALNWLATAIAAAPRYKRVAQSDSSFAALRADAEFQAEFQKLTREKE